MGRADHGRSALALLGCVLVAVVLVFGRALHHGATSLDEQALVFRNPVLEHFGARELRDAFDPRVPRLAYGLQYTPLADLSHALDRRLFGSDAGLHHLQSLLLHALATCAVFTLVGRGGGAPAAAAVAAMAFALHPLQVESVAWIRGRTTLLSGALLLWALVAWHRACVDRSRSAGWVATVLVLLANLSKQSAVVACGLLGVIEWTAVRLGQAPERSARDVLRAYVPTATIGVAFAVLGLWVGRREGIVGLEGPEIAAHLRLSLLAIAWYGSKLMWPVGLVPSYDFESPASWLDAHVLGGLAAVTVSSLLVLATRHRAPLVAGGLALAAIALVPALHGMGRHVVAARYAYLTVAGCAVAASVAWAQVARRAPRLAGVAVIVMTVVLGGTAFAQVGTWRDDLALFGDAVAKEPAKPLWHHLLGRALVDAGSGGEGQAELVAARDLNGGRPVDGYCPLPPVLGEMALLREQEGDAAGAEQIFVSALQGASAADVDRAAVDLGAFYLRHDDRPKARAAYAYAVAREPERARLSRYRLTWIDGLEGSDPGIRPSLPTSGRIDDNAEVAAKDSEAMIQDPRNRRWGLYYNRDDPRLVVPKRTFRPGWTLNFAHPYALPGLVFGFLFAVGPAILLERSGYATPLRMALVIALTIALLVLGAQRASRLP